MSSIVRANADEFAGSEAIDFACRAAALWQSALGDELLGAYLIGSLAHGGFSRRYSDVDVALVTEHGLSAPTLDRLLESAVELSADWGPKLSVFWTNRHFGLGRFPPLDRIDYIDHAVTLIEREQVKPERPHLGEIQLYLAGAPFGDWADLARRFAAAETLEAKDCKAYLRTLLYPGRLFYTWTTGCMGSNDDAVTFLDRACPARIDVASIRRALQCRQASADPYFLFPARATLLSQVDACAGLLAGRTRSSSH